MKELFRLRIASKRQITVPQRLMNALNLVEGDELRVTVNNKRIESVVPHTSVPADLVTPEMEATLERRRKEFMAGKTGDISALSKRLDSPGTQKTVGASACISSASGASGTKVSNY